VTAAAHPGLARADRLVESLHEHELDALLVQSLVDVRYMTGFTGSHGVALLLAGAEREGPGASAAPHHFLTDFRYTTQAEKQVPGIFAREIVTGDLLDAVPAILGDGGGRLGFDDATVTVAQHRRLGERLAAGWQLVPCTGMIAKLRLVKEAGEVERMRAAAQLADEALRGVLEAGLVGRSEREIAIELELRMRRLGAHGPSFPSIVAAGAHAALPHAAPRDSRIPRDVLVTIDWGAEYEGYCSDCTRTYATGEAIPDAARVAYAVVLDAQETGLAALAPGQSGRAVDAAARDVIERAGLGERFGHGLGHGVGMEIHEGPRLSRTAGEDPLPAGCVVTVEPGVYVPGELGVRIEDLVFLAEGAPEVLTGLPKELTVIS
jgi:Xaa-Pro aminopeptidase